MKDSAPTTKLMDQPRFIAFDHVQLAMPADEEQRAADFYVGVLGLKRVEKPAPMRASGGAWFAAGAVELHLGVETEFRPARKAHPAVRVEGLAALADRCESAGSAVEWDDRYPGVRRFYVHDPFGNRLEFLER